MSASLLEESEHDEAPVIMEQGHLPTHRAAFSLFNGTVGAALLNFPFVYYMFGGWPSAILVQTFISAIICGSFIILAIGTHKSGVNNFFDLLAFYISPMVSVFFQFYAVIILFGACVTYIILLQDQVTAGLLKFFKLTDAWYASDKFITFILSALLFYPFIIPKKLKAIGYVSLIGIVATAYLTAAIIAKYYVDGPADKNYKPTIDLNWNGAFETVGSMVFSFQNHIPSVTVFHEMKSTKLSRYIIASIVSTVLCHIVYLIFGIYGSLSFGSLVKDDIFLNYKHTDIVIAVARTMFIVVLLTSYAVTAHSARIALHKLLNSFWFRLKSYCGKRIRADDDDDDDFISIDDEIILQDDENLKAKIVSSMYPGFVPWFISGTVWFLLSYLLAIFTPGISAALGYLGSGATMYTMVIPGLCLIKMTFQDCKNFRFITKLLSYATGIFYVALGVFMCVIILYKTIMKGSS